MEWNRQADKHTQTHHQRQNLQTTSCCIGRCPRAIELFNDELSTSRDLHIGKDFKPKWWGRGLQEGEGLHHFQWKWGEANYCENAVSILCALWPLPCCLLFCMSFFWCLPVALSVFPADFRSPRRHLLLRLLPYRPQHHRGWLLQWASDYMGHFWPCRSAQGTSGRKP